MYLVLTLSLVAFSFLQGFSQWKTITPNKDFIYGVTKIVPIEKENTFLALGTQEVNSVDNGANWEVKNEHGLLKIDKLPPSNDIRYDLAFPTKNTGYLVSNNEIYKTTDGNKTWEKKLELTDRSTTDWVPLFNAIHFTDPLVGFAVGHHEKIFRTVNGGDHWEEISWTNTIDPYIEYTDVTFVDSLYGYISGYEAPDVWTNFAFQPFIMKTTDGGTTWDRFPIPTTRSAHRSVHLQFLNKDQGYALLTDDQLFDDEVFSTLDGGKTWEKVPLPSGFEINAAHWTVPGKGYLVGSEGGAFAKEALYQTSDSGLTWEKRLGEGNYNLNDIAFNSPDEGVIVGEGGELLATNDGGISWQLIFEPQIQLRSLAFHEDTAYAMIDGALWQNPVSQLSEPWNVKNDSSLLEFTPGLEVLANGHLVFQAFTNALLYSSTDKGKTLDQISSQPLLGPKLLISGNDIMTVGSILPGRNVVFLVSHDLGQTWKKHDVTSSIDFPTSFSQGSDGSLFVCTGEDVYTSGDSGESWQMISSFPQEGLVNGFFINSDTGMVVLRNQKMYRTANGGTNWSEVTFIPNKEVVESKFLFLNDTLGYMAGVARMPQEHQFKTSVWQTIDGGNVWYEEELPRQFQVSINELIMHDSAIYAAGGYGLMLKKELESKTPPIPVTPPITSLEDPLDDGIFLYPVPSSHSLTLASEFQLNDGKVHIYNATGHRVTSYDITGDTKELKLDISNLLPGLYFLTLHINDQNRRYKIIKK